MCIKFSNGKYRYWWKSYINRSTHNWMKQIFWSWECADNFLCRQHGKNALEFGHLLIKSQWRSHDWLLVRGGVREVLSHQRTWSRVERMLWGKNHAWLSLSSGSRVQFSTGCRLGEPHLLMAQVSYGTTWESPRVFPLLAANALVKSRGRELLLGQCLPLLC